MPCGCGRSYIVNENYGFSNGRRKDTSFKSFISFLLVVLLLWIVIYCILLTVTRKKSESWQQSYDSKTKFHGHIGQATTKNPDHSNKSNTLSIHPDHVETQSESSGIVRETQNVITISNEAILTTEVDKAQFKTSNTGLVKDVTTNSISETSQNIDYNGITEFFDKPDTVGVDTTTKSKKAFTDNLNILKTDTTKQNLLVTEMDIITELSDISQNRVTVSENKLPITRIRNVTREADDTVTNDLNFGVTDRHNFIDVSEQSNSKVSLESSTNKNTELNENFVNSIDAVSTNAFSKLGSVDSVTQKLVESTKSVVSGISTETINDTVAFKNTFTQIYEYITTNSRSTTRNLINTKGFNNQNVSESKVYKDPTDIIDKTTIMGDLKYGTAQYTNNATTDQVFLTIMKLAQTTLPYYNVATSKYRFEQTTNIIKNIPKEELDVVTFPDYKVQNTTKDDSEVTKNSTTATSKNLFEQTTNIFKKIPKEEIEVVTFPDYKVQNTAKDDSEVTKNFNVATSKNLFEQTTNIIKNIPKEEIEVVTFPDYKVQKTAKDDSGATKNSTTATSRNLFEQTTNIFKKIPKEEIEVVTFPDYKVQKTANDNLKVTKNYNVTTSKNLFEQTTNVIKNTPKEEIEVVTFPDYKVQNTAKDDPGVTKNYNGVTSKDLFEQTTNKIKNIPKKEIEIVTVPYKDQKTTKDNSEIIKKENVCTNSVCKEKASQILQLIDHSVDPCEDFYQFSCGGLKDLYDTTNLRYIDALIKYVYTFPNSNDRYSTGFRKFFGSCMKYENEYGYLSKVKQVLSSNIRDNNLTSLLAFLMLKQSTPLFEIRYGFVGGKEGYGMQVLPPDSTYETVGLKDWSLQSQIKKYCLNSDPKLKYQQDVNLPKVYNDYNDCKKRTFKRMAENFIMEKPDRIKISNADIYGPTLQNAILYEKYTKTYIDDLDKKYPQVDWQDFFNKITGKHFDSSTPIFLYMEDEYFEPVMGDLRDRILKTERDVIETLKLYYQLELYQNLLTPKQNKEQFCMDQTVQLMPEVAIKIFYEISGLANFSYKAVENVFQELKDKFYWLIEMSQMEEVSKKEYNNSLEKLTLKVFENDDLYKHFLVESYETSYIMDDYLSNVFMFIENKRIKRNSLRSGDPDFIFSMFLDSQFLEVPKPIPHTNIIAIPNTFLQKLNEIQVPTQLYVFESYLKFHLSRAIALYMSDIDQRVQSTFYRQFVNNLNSYLENEGETKMLKGQQLSYKPDYKLWRQMVQFSDPIRMADNIALDMAFKEIFNDERTYESLPWISSDYSPEHQFFILIAQEYCHNPTLPTLAQHLYETPNIPGIFRIDNMIMNSDVFWETFQCPQGTPMNPEMKTQFDSFVTYEEYEQASK